MRGPTFVCGLIIEVTGYAPVRRAGMSQSATSAPRSARSITICQAKVRPLVAAPKHPQSRSMPRAFAETVAAMNTTIRPVRIAIAPDRSQPTINANAAEDLEPRQIKREPHTDWPWNNAEVADVIGKLHRVPRFQRAGVNESATDNDREPEREPRPRSQTAPLHIHERRLHVVGCRHGFAACHVSQPPFSTNTFFSPAFSRSRSAT